MARTFLGIELGFATTGAIGVLLVAGMIANEQYGSNATLNLVTDARLQQEVRVDVASGRAEIFRAQIVARMMLLADKTEEVDKAMAPLAAIRSEAQARFDRALAHALLPENRERLDKLKAAFADYIGAVEDGAVVQKNILVQRLKQSEIRQVWDKHQAAVLASAADGQFSERSEVEANLRGVAAANTEAWLFLLRYASEANPELIKLAQQSHQRPTELLKSTRSHAGDAAAAGGIDDLTADIAAVEESSNRSMAAVESMLKIQRERAAPDRAAMEELVTQIAVGAHRLSEEKTAEVTADMTRAGRIGIGIGLVAIIVLMASTFIGGRGAANRKVQMRKLADMFEAAIGAIAGTVSSASTELEASASTLSHTAASTQGLATTAANSAEQASSNVQAVASASEELASSVNEIGRQVQESSRIASNAVNQANDTTARIGELMKAGSRIGDVVKLITAIADQTNLLALNATIEAARAGDAGRGFAVVASEVKTLANQTAKATDEIVAQIGNMQAATEGSVLAIKEIKGTIDRIAEISSAIAAAVDQQGAATREIARNVQQAAAGTSEVNQNISDVARGAGETGLASAQVLSAARELSNEGSHLKIEVDKFLVTVRAA